MKASTQGQVRRHDHGLRARFERHRSLRSAWGVLAPSSLSHEKQSIAETGRELSDDLMELAGQDPTRRDPSRVSEVDARLDAFEASLRAGAVRVPVEQLRSSLPARLAADRRGVLDLLDLMLGTEAEAFEGLEGRIAALDYVITLLCLGGSGNDAAVLHDPVGLTPRLRELCERSQRAGDPRLPEIEAEFFAAADLDETDVSEEVSLRSLRRRKTQLGAAYFAPRVLRAIVPYNSALLRRIEEQVGDSRNWGLTVAESAETGDPGSVFEAQAIQAVAAALRRRTAGESPGVDPVDRVVWGLDLEYPAATERSALRAESAGRRENPQATAILVGLLCRSAAVLEDEFPAMGISPRTLSGPWVRELDEILKREVNRLIAADEYKQACDLSELRTKFLYSPMSQVRRESRGHVAPRKSTPRGDEVGKLAAEFAREALEEGLGKPRAGAATRSKALPSRRAVRLALLVAGASLVLLVSRGLLSRSDLAGYSRDEFEAVARHLSSGARNREGRGPAFVGAMYDDFFGLTAASQTQAAADLVDTLRAQGVRQIMLYDGGGRLRIQALGSQIVRILPGEVR